jgi:hypothetical protein
MPVVGRSDYDGVDRSLAEKLAKVRVPLAVLVAVVLIDFLSGLIGMASVDVADRNDLRRLLHPKSARIVPPHATCADHSHRDALAGRSNRALKTEVARRHDQRRRQRACTGCQKLASRHPLGGAHDLQSSVRFLS